MRQLLELSGTAGTSFSKMASCWLGVRHLSPGAYMAWLEAGALEVETSPSPPLLGRVKDKLRQPKL